MNGRTRSCAYAFLLLLLPAAGRPDDRWEAGTFGGDDTAGTANELVHGAVQRGHDLQGAPDQDWTVARSKARHSYEARVSSGTVLWNPGNCADCAAFDRMTANGTAVLTPGVPDGATSLVFATTLAVRWIAAAAGNELLRVHGGDILSAIDMYDLEFHDTTYFLPRFNNSSSQVTVLVVQNTKDSPVAGEIHFYDAAGALLSTQPLSLAAQGVQVLNSAAVPALAGQSGSVTIAHLGGYGALAGKGVALEPATGFTFDTPLTPLPR
jgi:hypothetical protein